MSEGEVFAARERNRELLQYIRPSLNKRELECNRIWALVTTILIELLNAREMGKVKEYCTDLNTVFWNHLGSPGVYPLAGAPISYRLPMSPIFHQISLLVLLGILRSGAAFTCVSIPFHPSSVAGHGTSFLIQRLVNQTERTDFPMNLTVIDGDRAIWVAEPQRGRKVE